MLVALGDEENRWFGFQGYSRSVFILDFLLTLVFIAGIRLGIRLYLSRGQTTFVSVFRKKAGNSKRLLLIGAGNTGEHVLREMMDNPAIQMLPVGFLDDDAAKLSMAIHGVPVLGNVDQIVRNFSFWSPYPGTTDEVIRSIAPREFPRSNWMGYTKDADSLLQKYWRMVTRGRDSVWWWRWECIGRFHGWLAPDLRPYPAVKEILEDTRVVREGLGDLLLQSRMRDDGIAILYSYPSTFAHKLDEGAGFGEYEKAHVAWHKAIRDLGLQFSYVTDRMLRLGEFDGKRFRVLVLPRAEAIGE